MPGVDGGGGDGGGDGGIRGMRRQDFGGKKARKTGNRLQSITS